MESQGRSGVSGVPLTELHCPTCGVKYEDFSIYSDTTDYDELMRPIHEIVATPEPFHRLPERSQVERQDDLAKHRSSCS